MNIKIFNYLYDKKGKPLPFEYKLKNNIPLNESDLYFDGGLNLICSNIKELPDNLTVNGNLFLNNNKIKSIPDNLTVNGCLFIEVTLISVLPDNLTVINSLYCWNTPLATNIKNNPSLLTKYSKQIKGNIYYLII